MTITISGGLLVACEGIDGSGKTTQWRRLADRLAKEGYDVAALVEPTRGPVGRRIREMATHGAERPSLEDELALFIEDRRWNVSNHIRPALERGAVVLLDRYYYSTMAYQGARGLDPESIRRDNESFAPPADLTLYFDVPLQVVRERIDVGRGGRRDLFESEEYLARVRRVYESLRDPQMIRVDAARCEDAVFDEAWHALSDLLAARRGAVDKPDSEGEEFRDNIR